MDARAEELDRVMNMLRQTSHESLVQEVARLTIGIADVLSLLDKKENPIPVIEELLRLPTDWRSNENLHP